MVDAISMVDDSTKLFIKEQDEEQRKLSDDRYAMKIVERIVFSALAVIALAVLTSLVALVIKT